MASSYLNKITIVFIGCLITFLGILTSAIVYINSNGMNQRIQGMINLLWLPVIILFLVIDRLFVSKFGAKKVNKIECYLLGVLTVLFLIYWFDLLA
ncbi:hypothetical protein ACFSX9_11815 [Flavobacterium ardleyense]|uniref:Uncharacterized protein n=1 Tax=Flavobacterium ardleyense TaxID=2038737 RepID=A0ABW5ZA74_9FLAO